MTNDNEMTTIWLTKNTKDRFFAVGRYGESQDDIMNRILDIVEPILKKEDK